MPSASMVPESTVNFRDFYGLGDFESAVAVAEEDRRLRNSEGEGREAAFRAWLAEVRKFERRLGEFLQAKARKSELPLVDFSEGRGLRWADAWNRLVQQLHEGVDVITAGMGLAPMSLATFRLNKEDVEPAYERLVKLVHAGQNIEPMVRHGRCLLTGQVLHLRMHSPWRPVLGTVDEAFEFHALRPDVAPA